MKGKVKIRFLSDQQKKDPLERVAQEGFNLSHLLNNYLLQGWDCSSFQRLVEISSVFLFHMNQPLVSSWRLPGALSRARVGRLTVRQVETKKRELKKRKDNLPERMTTLTSFSSLEISELEVKGLILSLFQARAKKWERTWQKVTAQGTRSYLFHLADQFLMVLDLDRPFFYKQRLCGGQG